MKIYLASYFEPENHGHGRKISVSPSKPKDVKVDFKFIEFSPSKQIMDKYYQQRNENIKKAGEEFVSEYKGHLDFILNDLDSSAKENNTSIKNILPFQDGDTLLTWEKKGNTSYRSILAEYLIKIGYEVVAA